MIKTVSEILFYLVILALSLYSLIMVYSLLRYGQSKLLGIVVSALYLVIFFSLFLAALGNFESIPFPQTFSL